MIANVLVELSNRNIDKTFDYNIPKDFQKDIKVGIRVKVPFNNQTLEGFVMSISEKSSFDDLKDIKEIVDEETILTDELLELGYNVKEELLCTLISIYQAMLPKALKAQARTKINKMMEKCVVLNISSHALQDYKFNEKQDLIIERVTASDMVSKSELNSISSSSLKTLINKKVLKEIEIEKYKLKDNIYETKNKVLLNEEQQKAVDTILNEKKDVFLLHGVTGSGKTEVYMDIIEEMLKINKTSIVLVPEISLTPQILERFKNRFGNDIAVLHSRLNETEKYDEYRRIARGEVNIVIGARSAVFSPLKNIGVIIIDEEHSDSYKQENNPKYNAIDIAIKRGKYHNAKVILGSATPTLESYSKAITKRYELVELTKRPNNILLPSIEIIDMTKEVKKNGYFSTLLKDSISKCLENNEQVILLLNRRGYSSFITCSNCGYVAKCPNCDITLTFHKSSDMCRCHYCGYATKRIEVCPECHEQSVKNLGVGTEKIEEELKKLFSARIIRMDLDTTSTKGAHEKIISDFGECKYDILLGTQMISKGLDFPNVTLVGVINADTSLMIPSYKSSENTFQLLSQVSGRSGRGKIPGKVIIQTFNKEHYAINYARIHDYKSFFKHEMHIRKTLCYFPYYYMISIKIIGSDYELLKKESNKVANILKSELTSSITLGPSIGSIFKIKNNYRFGILIKYKKEDNLYKTLNNLINYYKSNSKIKIDIDFNPNNI